MSFTVTVDRVLPYARGLKAGMRLEVLGECSIRGELYYKVEVPLTGEQVYIPWYCCSGGSSVCHSSDKVRV